MAILIIKKQDGGIIDTTGYYNRSNALMKKYANLNWVARANDMTTSPPSVKGRSHFMGYDGIDGKLQAYPLTVQKKGENFLTNLSWEQAFEEAKDTKSFVPLGNDKDFAEYFTIVGYKQKFPKDVYDEAMESFSEYYNKRKEKK